MRTLVRSEDDPIGHLTSPVVTGGAVIALKYNEGIIIATDTLLSYGSLLSIHAFTKSIMTSIATSRSLIASSSLLLESTLISKRQSGSSGRSAMRTSSLMIESPTLLAIMPTTSNAFHMRGAITKTLSITISLLLASKMERLISPVSISMEIISLRTILPLDSRSTSGSPPSQTSGILLNPLKSVGLFCSNALRWSMKETAIPRIRCSSQL